MNEEGKNIEEIFRNKLENFESPVNDAMWSNISNSINSGAAGTASGVAGKTVLGKIFSTVGIAVTTGLVATGVTIFVMTEQQQEEPVKEEVITKNVEVPVIEPVTEEVTVEVQEEKKAIQIPTNKPTHEGDPVLKAKNIEKENKENPEKEKGYVSEPSAVSFFMTSQKELDRQKNQNAKNNNQEGDKNEQKTEVTENGTNDQENTITEKKEITASMVVFPVGGYAPLDVSFSNQSDLTNVTVMWNFGDGVNSREETPVHTYEEPGVYVAEVIITDENGNVTKDVKEIEVLAKSALTNIPNVFTPNDDGYNDVYVIEGTNIKEFKLVIIDRFGKEIFTSNSIDSGWNGKDKFGNNAPVGAYNFVVVAYGEDGKKYENTGFIQLIR